MDLLQLRQMGLVSSNPLIKKTVTIKYRPLKEGSETEREEEAVEASLDFWIRKFTAGDRIATANLSTSESPEEGTYLAIQRSIFTEEGKHVFPDIESVRELDLEMFAPLLIAINEINGGAPKKSQPRTNGGTASRSPSADEASRSGKSRSAKRKPNVGDNTAPSTAP